MSGTKDQWVRTPKAWTIAAVAILILILAPLALTQTQALWPRWIAIMALAWWLPGSMLVAHWRLSELDLPTAGILAIGIGLCWMILVALLVHWLPGVIDLWLLIAAYEVGALLLLVALFFRPPLALRPTQASTWGWLVALLVLAVLLRLPGIGYHEFHIDESVVLSRASSAIQGEDDALARHPKGPGEIAIASVVYRAMGTVNEANARLPFGLMSVASVLAVGLLGRRLFSATVGFWAGVLFAANGFALGLSRIVQYQPAMLLLSALAVLATWEFAERGQVRWLVLAVAFSAFGLVMHYEFALLAPVLFALAWVGWKRTPDKRRVGLRALVAAIAASVILAAVYIPALFNPKFARTQEYLAVRLGDSAAFNIPFFVELGTFYNSTYFFFGLIFLTTIGLFLGWRAARRRTLVLTLWFAPYLIVYLFVITFPGTHFYLLMESWSLLAALPLAAVTQSRRIRPWVRGVLLGLAVAWLVISAGYLYLMFFQQSPEYLANYEKARVPFYWAPYGENVPVKPRFGFPMQRGWKALGMLTEWGYLGKNYASNERARHVPSWYLAAAKQVAFSSSPDLILVASYVHELHPQYDDSYLESYQRIGEVQVHNEPRIELWAQEPLPAPYVVYHAEDFAIFDRIVPALSDWPDPSVRLREVALGETMVLKSAGVADTSVTRGDTLQLLLVWQPQEALATDYKLFVHVADESGRPVAQWDGYPCLNTARTSQWPVGESVRDHVLMSLPDGMPSGTYSLLVGLYDETTGERLGGQAIQVATITIR